MNDFQASTAPVSNWRTDFGFLAALKPPHPATKQNSPARNLDRCRPRAKFNLSATWRSHPPTAADPMLFAARASAATPSRHHDHRNKGGWSCQRNRRTIYRGQGRGQVFGDGRKQASSDPSAANMWHRTSSPSALRWLDGQEFDVAIRETSSGWTGDQPNDGIAEPK